MKLLPVTRSLVLLAALAAAGSASADRPSLIELQATLDQVVDGLCGGDPATCGPPATPAVGTITFAPGAPNQAVLPLVDLVLSIDAPIACSPSCMVTGGASFSSVSITVEQTAQSAQLLSQLASGTSVAATVTLTAVGGGKLDLLFTSALLSSFSAAATPGLANLAFAYQQVTMLWQGSSSGWNRTTATGSGCTVPAGEAHVELAGNAAGALLSGEIAAVYALGAASMSVVHPALSFTRRPPNPCYLRSAALPPALSVKFDRLWSQDDAFPARQSVESVDAASMLIDRWELRVHSGVVSEKIDLVLASGTLTTRSFNPATGAQTGIQSWGF